MLTDYPYARNLSLADHVRLLACELEEDPIAVATLREVLLIIEVSQDLSALDGQPPDDPPGHP
jgi:hypothetical protein